MVNLKLSPTALIHSLGQGDAITFKNCSIFIWRWTQVGSQLCHGTSLKPALKMTISPNEKLVQNLKRSAKLFGWFDQRNTYMTISRNTYMAISSWQSEYGEQ